jgi:Ca2+-binding RTX toxin-like protein
VVSAVFAGGSATVVPARSAFLTVLLALLLSSSASAAVVERAGSEIRYVAAAGEVNQAESQVVPGVIIVHEFNPAVPLTASAGCARPLNPIGSDAQVECPSDGVTDVRFDFGDLNDRHSAGYDTGALVVHLFGGDGDDQLVSRSGTDLIDGGPGNDTIMPGDGLDQVTGGAGNDDITDFDPLADRLEGGDGDDDITGSDGPDLLVGGSGDDDLVGGDGDDRLDGGAGEDKLDGGRGKDVLDGGPGEDDVDGGRGDDRLVTADTDAEHTLACGQGTDQLEADARDPVNVDCEDFDGGRVNAAAGTVRLLVACPGSCANGRIVLTAGGALFGTGTFGASASAAQTRSTTPRVRLTSRGVRLMRRHRTLRVRARIVARDTTGRTFRSRGRYVVRRR